MSRKVGLGVGSWRMPTETGFRVQGSGFRLVELILLGVVTNDSPTIPYRSYGEVDLDWDPFVGSLLTGLCWKKATQHEQLEVGCNGPWEKRRFRQAGFKRAQPANISLDFQGRRPLTANFYFRLAGLRTPTSPSEVKQPNRGPR